MNRIFRLVCGIRWSLSVSIKHNESNKLTCLYLPLIKSYFSEENSIEHQTSYFSDRERITEETYKTHGITEDTNKISYEGMVIGNTKNMTNDLKGVVGTV